MDSLPAPDGGDTRVRARREPLPWRSRQTAESQRGLHGGFAQPERLAACVQPNFEPHGLNERGNHWLILQRVHLRHHPLPGIFQKSDHLLAFHRRKAIPKIVDGFATLAGIHECQNRNAHPGEDSRPADHV